jgi:hypothetical protein
MAEQIPARLTECITLWNSAERAAKEAELITGRAILASVNELRYAGRWIVLALDAIVKGTDRIDDLTTLDDVITFARLCCIQAKHDAIDSIILYLNSKVELVSETYGVRIISMFVEGYVDFLADVQNIADSIILSRQDRHNRLDIYEKILQDHIPRIKQFMLKIRAAEAAMVEQTEQEKQRIQDEQNHHEEVVRDLTQLADDATNRASINNRWFWISFAVNVILAVISIVLAIIALK